MQRFLRPALLLAIVAAGAFLRFRDLGVPSFWLDESLAYDMATRAAHEPWWRWLTGIEAENGALYFASELAGRLFSNVEFSARLAPALFGVATIVIAWCSEEPLFALLLAGAPLNVYYSREARPYALLLILTTALLVAMLRNKPRVVMALLIAAAYSSATTFPVIVTCVACAVVLRWWRVAISGAVCAAAIPLLYRGGGHVPSFPAWTLRLFRDALDSFSAVAVDHTHLHRVAYLFLAFAIGGAIVALRRDRVRGLVIIAFAIGPASISLAALWKLNHFYAVRYLAASLPGFLLLVAIGITAAASLARRAAPAVAMIIALAIMRDGFIAARTEPYQKLNWRAIAATLAQHAHADDAVVATNDWTYQSLVFYLRGAQHVHVFNARGSATMAEIFVFQQPRAWIVDAGEHALSNEFLCRFPVVLATARESFRLHYSPSLHDFLTTRASLEEQRKAATNEIGFGAEDAAFLGEGWGPPDRDGDHFARWSIGRKATIALPLDDAPRDHDVTIDIQPMRGASTQRLSLAINDVPIGEIALRDESQTITFHAPRERWRAGVNILTFTFDRATAPANIDPHSTDHRELSARFSRVALDGALASGALHRPRLDLLLDDGQRKLKLPPQLIALADESFCLDDDQFVRDAFATIQRRRIDDASFKTFRTMLTRGVPRTGVLRAIATAHYSPS